MRKVKIFIVISSLLILSVFNIVQAQSLSNLQQRYVIAMDDNNTTQQSILLAFDISALENVDHFVFGIGSSLEQTDVWSQSTQVHSVNGQFYLNISGEFRPISGNNVNLSIPGTDQDLTGKFFTVYAVLKNGTITNKLSIQAN